MEHKYIRVDGLGFVLFPRTDVVAHSRAAQLFGRAGEIISAGFVSFPDGKPRCFGMSESIGIGGLPDDSEALAKQLNAR